MGSFPFPRNGIVEIDYEFILIFKKAGKAPNVTADMKEQSRIPKEKWKEYFCGHWYFNGAKQDNHIAMFPVELPKRAIEMFTFVGETVLDPFLGSGTTCLAAMISERNSIGYEINREFLPIIERKLNAEKNTLFNNSEICIEESQSRLENNIDWQNEISRLPYVFSDPVKFDKKVDPNKLKFGSRINTADSRAGVRREEYFTVKQILEVNLIKLNNDLVIRLIGVKARHENQEAALTFLRNKILKRQIFLKFDEEKHDSKGQLLAYVYLKNKTFINAHLLKHGFADLDTEYPFKHLAKLEKLQQDRARQPMQSSFIISSTCAD